MNTHVVTKFDGKMAMILKGHPHAGNIAVCKGADKTPVGWAMLFMRLDTNDEFYVFDGKLVKWEEQK